MQLDILTMHARGTLFVGGNNNYIHRRTQSGPQLDDAASAAVPFGGMKMRSAAKPSSGYWLMSNMPLVKVRSSSSWIPWTETIYPQARSQPNYIYIPHGRGPGGTRSTQHLHSPLVSELFPVTYAVHSVLTDTVRFDATVTFPLNSRSW